MDIKPLWKSLSQNARGALRFHPDGFYNFNYDVIVESELMPKIVQQVKRKNFDLLFTMGTQSSESAARVFRDIPVISLDHSAPLSHGFLKHPEDHSRKNVHVRAPVNMTYAQVRHFYTYRPFTKLGALCAKHQTGSMGFAEIQRACEDLGVKYSFHAFQVAEFMSTAKRDNYWFELFFQKLRAMVEEDGVDAFILPYFPSNDNQFLSVVKYLADKGIASFAQTGVEPVKRGLLLGMSDSIFKAFAQFEADVVRRYLSGIPLEAISQRFSPQIPIALNLRTATLLGWKPSFQTFSTVSDVFLTHSRVVSR